MTSLLALTGNNTLLSFESEQPNDIESISVMGVDGTLLGVDTRPANGMVYGITDTDKIYTIDLDTGMATQISMLNMPFNATSVTGFDFNPVADRLRLVGDNEQDFRINVDTGEVTVDGDLAFAAGDPNAGDDPSITAAAYTNSFAGTTTTALYDIDQAQDILVLQDPPNDGVLKTIGELGIDFGGTGGFEIAYTPAGTNEAFAISNDMLYAIDLGMGSATPLGMVDSQGSHFRGLTARAERQVNPIAQNSQFLALTDDDKLVSFDPSRPDVTTTIEIAGLDSTLIGIDTRPANGLVYGITTSNTVYTIDPETGSTTKISTLDESFNAANVSGFDFNPVADRLRLVGDNEQDFRINVDTGEVTIDGDLAFATGDANEGANPKVTAVAYANSIANPSTTALYDIDTDLDILALQNPPNDGTLLTRGPLGINIGQIAGFDIVSSGEEDVGARIMAGQELEQNAAFAVADGALYDINILTGAATRLSSIGDGSGSFKGLATVGQPAIVDPIAQNSQFLALTDDDKLVSFDPNSLDMTTTIEISGIDAPLLGIDTRPPNGLVYGITTANTVYTINPNTGVATKISTLDESFNARNVSGFDFNPVADRLRLVGDNDQDFRINVETGEVTIDGNLAYAVGDVNEGANPRVTAVAYANSIANPSTTALYDIDTDLDILALQNPPNDGILLTRGPLGIDIDEIAGFEIVSSGEENVGDRIMSGQELEQNAAFAVADGTLYDISILTGAATRLGDIGGDDSDSFGGFKGLATVDQSAIVDPIAQDSQFLALTDDDKLMSFDPSRPDMTITIDITGIDAPLLGIDTRPSNGLVYGITTANTVYTINPNSGVATQISTLDESFNATNVSGFDFNPVADRLRLVGDNDQDFRINVETGAVTIDGDLAYAAGDVNEGVNPRVTAVAYANSIANPSTTALYDIDTDLDILVLQNPPNDGTLITRGPLGIDVDETAGFEIVSSGEENVGDRIMASQNLQQNAAFAVTDGALYDIDILTGKATLLSDIGDGSESFKGLTAVDSSSVVDPVARNSTFLALTDDGQIAMFDPSNPEAAQSMSVSGLRSADEVLLGFDTRPANGLIYGITNADNLYTIDPTSGQATFVSTLDMPFNAGQISGFDFNPVADRLRLVGDNDQDFRINVDTGEVTVDGDLAYAAGDVNEGANPTVTAAAYTNAIANPTATQLYDIDTDLDTLVLQNPPNDGTLMTIGELGVDFGEQGGFDIVSPEQGSNAAFAVSNGTLYSIDLLTGEASSLGTVGTGTADYVGFTTISNDSNGGSQAPIFIQADDNGVTSAVVYDITGASQADATLGIDPSLASDAGFDNFIGLYEVVDTAGGVDVDGDGIADFNPGDNGYAAAAIGQRVNNFDIRTGGDASDNTSQSGFGTVSLDRGFYAPFLIANLGSATPEDFLTNNPNNAAAEQMSDSVAYFSFIEANPDGVGHLMSMGMGMFGFEDLPGNLGGSDNDFNDAVFQVDINLL